MIEIGVCCLPDNFAAVKAAGLDYTEISMAYLHDRSAEELKEIKRKADSLGLKTPGFNGFFGGGISLYNDPLDKILSYCKQSFEIANSFDASYCVFGCGWLRRVPEGADKAETEKRFSDILFRIAKLAAEYGVEIALEPLCYDETDLINTFKEGLKICRAANLKNLGCLVDFYHFFKNGEDLSVFDTLKKGEPRHVHLARPNIDRKAPTEEDGEALKVWADKLKNAGYDGRVSLECRWVDFDKEVKIAAPLLRDIFKGA